MPSSISQAPLIALISRAMIGRDASSPPLKTVSGSCSAKITQTPDRIAGVRKALARHSKVSQFGGHACASLIGENATRSVNEHLAHAILLFFGRSAL